MYAESIWLIILFIMKGQLKWWWYTISPISTKRTTTSHFKPLNPKDHNIMVLEILILAWDRHKNVAELNWLMGSQSLLIIGSPYLNLISIIKYFRETPRLMKPFLYIVDVDEGTIWFIIILSQLVLQCTNGMNSNPANKKKVPTTNSNSNTRGVKPLINFFKVFY